MVKTMKKASMLAFVVTFILLITFSTNSVFAASSWSGLRWVGYYYENQGPNVKAVQLIVSAAGYGSTVGTIDSAYGDKTHLAVEYYQESHGLSADGTVGTNTWNEMRGHLIFDWAEQDFSQVYYYASANNEDPVFDCDTSGYWYVQSYECDGDGIFDPMNY